MSKSQPKSSSNKLALLLVLALLLSMVSIIASLFTLNKIKNNAQEDQAGFVQENYYAALEPAFVVNFEQEGLHYMQVSVAIMAHDENKLNLLSRHFPILRDKLVMLFAAQDFKQLQTIKGKEKLRTQATKYAQQVAIDTVGEPIIEQILFTNLVLQ